MDGTHWVMENINFFLFFYTAYIKDCFAYCRVLTHARQLLIPIPNGWSGMCEAQKLNLPRAEHNLAPQLFVDLDWRLQTSQSIWWQGVTCIILKRATTYNLSLTMPSKKNYSIPEKKKKFFSPCLCSGN